MVPNNHNLLHVWASCQSSDNQQLVDIFDSSILTGLPAGAYGAANDQMAAEFHVDNSGFPWLSWATASWNIGAAFWPLIFVPLTENTGR